MKKKSKLLLGLALTLLLLGGVVVLAGAIGKVQHWGIAGTLLLVGLILEVISGFCFFALIIRYFYEKDRQSEVLSH